MAVKLPGTDIPRVEPETLAEWRRWLSDNHAVSGSVWLVAHKKASPLFAFTFNEAVEEALCFGWIDSLPRKLDAVRSMLLFSPRKSGSLWSAVNKSRVEKLIASGRMTAAGLAKINAARSDGTWTALDSVEALDMPPDLAAALAEHPGSRTQFDGFPRSARRGILEWILQAKTPQTRAKRILETAAKAAVGERANQWRKS